MDLAWRSGKVQELYAHPVYANDDFSYRLGLNRDLIHVPTTGDRGAVIASYAVVRLKDGGLDFEVCLKTDIDKARSVSKAKNDGPWVTHYEEMARKTAILRLAKRLPLSTDFQRAAVMDEYADQGLISMDLKDEIYEASEPVETEARIKGEVGGPGSGELVDAEFDAMDGAANEPTGRVFGAANRPEPKMVECQYCGNEYTAGSGLTRHENVCPHKKTEKPHEAEIEESDPTPFPNVDPALFDSHSFKNLKILLQSEKSKAVWDRVFAHKEITEEDQITKAIGYIQKQVQRETISTVGER